MRFLKRACILSVMVAVLFSLTACSKVPAGNVGIKVYLLGTSKGVDTEELGVGRYYIGINEELYLFPTFTQNYVWTKSEKEGSPNDESITFQTVEGMTVGADVGISYHINPSKVSLIFQKYRKGVEEITDIFLRNMVRDAFVKASEDKAVEYVYGKGKSELLSNVEDIVKEQVEELGIIIERIYLVGQLRLPGQVTKALNLKIQATQLAQQRENEIRAAIAEAEKKIAEADGTAKSRLTIATAKAKANKIVSASLTPELIKYYSLEKWNGELPQIMGGNGVLPMIQMK